MTRLFVRLDTLPDELQKVFKNRKQSKIIPLQYNYVKPVYVLFDIETDLDLIMNLSGMEDRGYGFYPQRRAIYVSLFAGKPEYYLHLSHLKKHVPGGWWMDVKLAWEHNRKEEIKKEYERIKWIIKRPILMCLERYKIIDDLKRDVMSYLTEPDGEWFVHKTGYVFSMKTGL